LSEILFLGSLLYPTELEFFLSLVLLTIFMRKKIIK